jgi:hypothetical protein
VAKWTGIAEQYDGGKEVFVGQEGVMVTLTVEKEVSMVTPSQARSIAAELVKTAQEAEGFDG